MRTALNWVGTVARQCIYGRYNVAGGGGVIDQLSDYRLLEEDSAPLGIQVFYLFVENDTEKTIETVTGGRPTVHEFCAYFVDISK
jgi:hypothetical protein